MGARMRAFVAGLFYEAGAPSWTRVTSAALLLAFLSGSAYLMLTGQTWAHYDTFAAASAGGGTGLQAFNKFVNSTLNSPPGQFPAKGGGAGGTVGM